MDERDIVFWVAGEEILRLSEDGGVFLRGERIGDDKVLYEGFLRWKEFHGPYVVSSDIPETEVSPGSVTFWVEGEEGPFITLDLSGVHVRGKPTTAAGEVLGALREFLDAALEEAGE